MIVCAALPMTVIRFGLARAIHTPNAQQYTGSIIYRIIDNPQQLSAALGLCVFIISSEDQENPRSHNLPQHLTGES
ncbi:hypothetical protein F4679DRAFT_556549 [Xylaria curta]|nr:hypothetical protein F4679DRAFT_556549 [Xylaria curta]